MLCHPLNATLRMSIPQSHPIREERKASTLTHNENLTVDRNPLTIMQLRNSTPASTREPLYQILATLVSTNVKRTIIILQCNHKEQEVGKLRIQERVNIHRHRPIPQRANFSSIRLLLDLPLHSPLQVMFHRSRMLRHPRILTLHFIMATLPKTNHQRP